MCLDTLVIFLSKVKSKVITIRLIILGQMNMPFLNNHVYLITLQVNFTQRRNVEAIITQDRDGLLQWVTSYHVQYYDDVSSTWRYVTDDNVEIMVMMSLLLIFSKIPKEMFDMKSMQWNIALKRLAQSMYVHGFRLNR